MTTILVIGAHPDDEIYGCGGTVHRLVTEGCTAHALIITEGCTAQYPHNDDILLQKKDEATKAAHIIGYATTTNAGLPDMKLDSIDHIVINKIIEDAIATHRPDIVFTHYQNDINLDHRCVHLSTMVACRPGSGVGEIRHYETPSSTEWGSGFDPNLFYTLPQDSVDAKIKAISCYKSELRQPPHPRSPEKIQAWASYRGCAAGCTYAEAFLISKKWV